MSDPLRLIRKQTVAEKPIKEITHNGEKYYVFGDIAYPRDTHTQLLVYNRPNEYYSMESIIFLWNNRQVSHTVYVKEAANKNVKAVTRIDRKEILDFLKGDQDDIPTNHDAHQPPRAPIPVSRLQTEGSEPAAKRPKLDGNAGQNQRMDLLNRDEQMDSSQIRSLNDNLTADKIAALKKKRMNHQKKTVVSTTADDDVEMHTETSLRIDREAKNRERVWRTRYNCMEATSKDFSTVFDILKSIRIREESDAKKSTDNGNGPSKSSHAHRPKPQAGYSRYDQEAFNPDTNEFAIDATMSFVGSHVKPGQSLPESKPLQPLNAPSTSGPRPTSQPPPSASSRSNSGSGDQPRKRTNRTPIIVVPPTGALISMLNVKDVLQEMHFISPEDKKSSGCKRENETQIHRKRGEVTVPFRVVENATRLTDEEWDRVVAVFVMGPAWQFKGWKYNGNPVEIFSHIAAFHLYYDDLKMEPNVAKWNVTKIPISRTKRHLDKARLVKFWDVLDRHIVKHKSHLRY